jgi:hypothetical protein
MALEKVRPYLLSGVSDADTLSGEEHMLIDNEDEVLRLNLNTVRLARRITRAQRNALTPTNGMVIYQTDNTPGLRFYENGAWVRPTVSADP